MVDKSDQYKSGINRRDFISSLAAGSSAAWAGRFLKKDALASTIPQSAGSRRNSLDLSPAKWIWYPSERCLQNTFILFRRVIELDRKILSAKGWILADSRYQLFVNGQRIQWGPAPSDPRWPEADPMDLHDILKSGENVIGVQVLFYGQGDGTWPIGKPGLLFRLQVEYDDGAQELIVSDMVWRAFLARSWPPGHYKRWYLRSLQEEFDARLFPRGWADLSFHENEDWLDAMELKGAADKPSICTSYPEYMMEIRGDEKTCALRTRSIPFLSEYDMPVSQLTESMWLKWRRPVREYFECKTPGAFETVREAAAVEVGTGIWQVDLDGEHAAVLTFELSEQGVGWPYFDINAPEGTIVELLVHEAHQPGGPALLNTHYHSWTRFICREGRNTFETFDYESCRWLQLHIHGAAGRVTLRNIGLKRRTYPWPNPPVIKCSEKPLQRLFDAAVNTLNNAAQETLVDGMARERQQYSGDVGHQIHALYYAFGEKNLIARYLATFSQGLTLDGYFLDCWPAYDRLARLMERQMQLTKWGPILDHGVGFVFDCYHYYMYTADLEALAEPFPRLLRFCQYLHGIVREDGLLPVEDIGIPSVWIDHDAYQQNRHKQCAFNLYAAAMLEHAMAPLSRAFGDERTANAAVDFGQSLLKAAIRKYWDRDLGLFVNNKPWLHEETTMRTCDRSLATAVLFDQCPEGHIAPSIKILSECPGTMGLSYPANAGWRLWALAKDERADVILDELRKRWASMDSVLLNKTLSENWHAQPDSGSQWSHCPVAPLYVLFMSLAGIRPLTPGFGKFEIRPQLADLGELSLTAYTIHGGIEFLAQGTQGDRSLRLKLPKGSEAELVVDAREKILLKKIADETPTGKSRYHVPPNEEISVRLKYT